MTDERRQELEAHLEQLNREIANAPGWGAGLTARSEEREGILAALGLPSMRIVGGR